MYPDDPLAPVSDAAAYLFAEFDRLKILQSEFFLHDENFRGQHQKLYADPAVRKAFDADLAKADRLATSALHAMPRDSNALFASVMVLGAARGFRWLDRQARP